MNINEVKVECENLAIIVRDILRSGSASPFEIRARDTAIALLAAIPALEKIAHDPQSSKLHVAGCDCRSCSNPRTAMAALEAIRKAFE